MCVCVCNKDDFDTLEQVGSNWTLAQAVHSYSLTPGMYSIKMQSFPSALPVPKYITTLSCRRFFSSCTSVSNDRTS